MVNARIFPMPYFQPIVDQRKLEAWAQPSKIAVHSVIHLIILSPGFVRENVHF